MSRARAIEAFTDRLKYGQAVDGCSLGDLIECDLDKGASMSEVTSILLSEYPDTPSLQEKYHARLIAAFLADPKREPLIQEEIATIEAERAEDERFEREYAS